MDAIRADQADPHGGEFYSLAQVKQELGL